MTIDTLSFIHDRLLGLNVREHNYLEEIEPTPRDPRHYGEDTYAPFALLVWDDGLDYDLDGNAYQDDCPGDYPHSYHATRKSAEIMAAILEDHGTQPWRLRIVEDYPITPWEQDKLDRDLAINR